MPKLTVYLQNSFLCSHSFETETVRIGRDETNDLVIDDSAFAPAHAVIVTRSNDCIIKQLNENFPLIINGKSVKESNIHHGDTITVGKHDLVYSTNHTEHPHPTKLKAKNSYIPHVANYQVLSGVGIGKIFQLDSPMTMLGEQGRGVVVISKRKDGYFAAILEKADTITLNKQALGDSAVKLSHNDVLVVGTTTVHFYLH